MGDTDDREQLEAMTAIEREGGAQATGIIICKLDYIFGNATQGFCLSVARHGN